MIAGLFRLLLGVLAALTTVGAAEAGMLREELVYSAALGEDLNYVVYVPDGYDASTVRYPVLYLLHGAGGDTSEWTGRAHIQVTADQLIASGKIPPALIVIPECRACWWVDSGRSKMETAFWSDLVPQIARQFRTIETREGRLVAGFSAGGYGAVRFALKYPERIAAIAAFSPAVYADMPPLHSAARTQLPFRAVDGAFSASLWKARNYPSLLTSYKAQPNRVAMFLVSGDHDSLGIAFETALLFKVMFELQPEQVELRVLDGGHSLDVATEAMPQALTYLFQHVLKPTALDRGKATVSSDRHVR